MGGGAAVGEGGRDDMTDDEYVGTLISNLVTPLISSQVLPRYASTPERFYGILY